MSNAPEAPFVRMRAREIMSVLPMLKGCFAQVYLTVAAFEADPIAPTVNDISDYTTLTRQSVSTALRFLCKHEVIESIRDESGTIRYRACFGFSYGADVRPGVRDVKKVLTRHDDVHINSTPLIKASTSFIHGNETKEILTSIGVQGSNLKLLVESVEPELAARWRDWIESKPDRFTLPVAYMVKQLKANAHTEPPATFKKAEHKREFHAQGVLWERLQAERAKKEYD